MDSLDLHPFIRITAHDKALGAIIGATLGDAIGLYTEFLPRAECSRAYSTGRFSLLEADLTPFREDSHRDKFEPADWTDDTDQSLALILSFLHNYVPGSDTPPVKPSDIAERLQIWVQQGLRCLDRPPLGIGMTTGRVLMDPEYLRDPEARLQYRPEWVTNAHAPAGSDLLSCDRACAGNYSGEVVTEGDLDALIEASFAWVDGNAELKNPTGKSLNEEDPIMMEGLEGVESTLKRDEYRKYCYAKTLRQLELDDKTMGYVFKCLGSAVLTLRFAIREGLGLDTRSTGLFERLISNLVMEGGDADTNACVAGALVGSWVGYSRLPSHWSKGMRNAQWLVAKAETLSFKSGIMEPRPKARVTILAADPDTALDGSKGLLNKEQLGKMEKDFVLKMLLMQKARREAKEAADTAARKGTGVGKWFR
ncbi:hypothetical protein VF21_05997 [Pseudogymnoascus sp. 05NY08]|nr:hypothetical protein VF21_05997 [Pseudogymnoascus sp. 05NY08]